MKLIHAFKSLVSHLNPFMEEDLTALTRACQVGNLNKVVKLLTKKQLRINPIPVESILTSAIMHGQVDIINYLLTSSNAKEFQKPDLRMAKLLESAAIHGQKEVITYFLLSDTDKYKMPQSKENIVLDYLSQLLHFDIIDSLIKSPLFSDKIDLLTNNDILFVQLYNNRKDDFLDYLIFERKLEKTQAIEIFLNNSQLNRQDNPYLKQIKHMFEVRDLNNDLNNELKTNIGNSTKKIKV
jgi:hypothetical protein